MESGREQRWTSSRRTAKSKATSHFKIMDEASVGFRYFYKKMFTHRNSQQQKVSPASIKNFIMKCASAVNE